MKSEAPLSLLRKLCSYYLDCLALEAAGVVVTLTKKPLMVELPTVAFLEGPAAPAPDGVSSLLSEAAKLPRPSVFLGFPVLVSGPPTVRTITPVLLWSLEAHPGAGLVRYSELPPLLNLAALKALPGHDTGSAVDESLLLGDTLQVESMTGGTAGLIALGKALETARPGWPWKEKPDGTALAIVPPLKVVPLNGLYNRAVLIAVEKELYTLGLERELRDLKECTADEIAGTALERFLSSPRQAKGGLTPRRLLQPVPLNHEQLEAVDYALSQPLVPITGPPGTGKSQVVAGILVNAAYSGQSTLFASKNNKAVEVVEERVNSLTSVASLLRLGQPDHNVQVANRLDALLSASVVPGDVARLKSARLALDELYDEEDQAEVEDAELLVRRNEVDRLAAETEPLRLSMTPAGFSAARTADAQGLGEDLEVLSRALAQATRTLQPWFLRLMWPFVRRPRFQRLALEGARFGEGRLSGDPPPGRKPDDLTLPLWRRWASRVAESIQSIRKAQVYHRALDELLNTGPDQERGWADIRRAAEIVDTSRALWDAWLRTLPDRLTTTDLSVIGRYVAALKSDIAAKAAGKGAGPDVRESLRKSFPGVLRALPCWGVTSLSARGRIPWTPRLFDLLVIDEASQSDIASLLPLLLRAKRAVVIGDPMQLKHITAITPKQDQALCQKHALGVAEQAWRYPVNSAWDKAASQVDGKSKFMLRDHHRSHADIIEFSNQHFYDGKLRVMTRVENLKRPDEGPTIEWIDVKGDPVRPKEGGVINEPEAHAVLETLERLLLRLGYAGSVGVTSPFRKQADRIQELVQDHPGLRTLAAKADLSVRTVHQFQGDERDVIIFSPAIGGDGPKGALTFLRRNAYLFNVAVTRARARLIVVADRAGAACCGVEYLEKFVAWVDQVERSSAAAPLDPDKLGPAYPPDPAVEPRYDCVKALYSGLFAGGFRPIPRYPLNGVTVDLAILAGDGRLAIEVLGDGVRRPWLDEDVNEVRRDVRRLAELGWDVLTVWPWEVRDRLPECIEEVRSWSYSL